MHIKDIFPVPARELHQAAGISTPFSKWIKGRIRSLNLSEKNDYLIETDVSPHNHRTMYNFFLTVESALEISNRMHDKLKRNFAFIFIKPYHTPAYQQWRKLRNFVRGCSTEFPF